MNVLGTTTMVKLGQKIPFKPAYVMALALQLLMILAMPMLAFWSPEEAAWQCRGRWRQSSLQNPGDMRESSHWCSQANDDVVTPSTWGFAAALACCAVP